MINTFTSLQDEWNAVPSLVLDIDGQSTESWTSAILRNGVIIQIPRLAAIKGFSVLANDDILGLNRRNSPKNPDLRNRLANMFQRRIAIFFYLFIANVFSGK